MHNTTLPDISVLVALISPWKMTLGSTMVFHGCGHHCGICPLLTCVVATSCCHAPRHLPTVPFTALLLYPSCPCHALPPHHRSPPCLVLVVPLPTSSSSHPSPSLVFMPLECCLCASHGSVVFAPLAALSPLRPSQRHHLCAPCSVITFAPLTVSSPSRPSWRHHLHAPHGVITFAPLTASSPSRPLRHHHRLHTPRVIIIIFTPLVASSSSSRPFRCHHHLRPPHSVNVIFMPLWRCRHLHAPLALLSSSCPFGVVIIFAPLALSLSSSCPSRRHHCLHAPPSIIVIFAPLAALTSSSCPSWHRHCLHAPPGGVDVVFAPLTVSSSSSRPSQWQWCRLCAPCVIVVFMHLMLSLSLHLMYQPHSSPPPLMLHQRCEIPLYL